MIDLTTLFCEVDDFFKKNIGKKQNLVAIEDGKIHRHRKKSLSPGEIMTIMIAFHASNYRNFKAFYREHVCAYLTGYFPTLLSYNRFIEIMPTVLGPLCGYLRSRFTKPTGIAYIDSTKIEVCGKKRMTRNKVFAGLAEVGKTTMGWFLVLNYI